MGDTDFPVDGTVYSPSTTDGIEVIAGHVLSQQQLMASHKPNNSKTAAASIRSGIVNAFQQRRSNSLAKRLDAKKTMAEISIPVRTLYHITLPTLNKFVAWYFS